MKLDTHWLIDNIGFRNNKNSVVLDVEEIVELAKSMREDDVIYTYHPEKDLNRIAVYGTDQDRIVLSIHDHGGGFDKEISFNELSWYLNNFEKVIENSDELGFKPDWE